MQAAVELIVDPQTSIEESTDAMTDINLKGFNIEAFTLLGIALLVTVLRSVDVELTTAVVRSHTTGDCGGTGHGGSGLGVGDRLGDCCQWL